MRILIAEDEAVSRLTLARTLTNWGHEVTCTANGREAWDILQKNDAPRLAILDWMMPELEGVELCRRLRARQSFPYVYTLLVTARSKRDDLLLAMEEGVDDYITKPWDAAELRARINAGLRIVRLQDELIHARDELQFQASHDALTTLPNRREILRILETELSRCRRQKAGLGVLIGDLDHFKAVNDKYGHLAGDAVLQEAAVRLRCSVRAYDSVGRYGGEEFLVVVPGIDALGLLAQADRFLAALNERCFDAGTAKLNLSLSLGAAVTDDLAHISKEKLLRAADSALYRAKKNGRDRVEFASPAEIDGFPAIMLVNSSEQQIPHI